MKPNVCILRSDGANCDEELFYAFEKFGGKSEFVNINELRNKSKKLSNYQILALPGGFSYGDDIASGKVLAIELTSFLKDQLQAFVVKDNLVIGICNGFQTLVRTGLVPDTKVGEMDVTLTDNNSGHFECRWVKIKMQKNKCIFLDDDTRIMDVAVNHGEGKFFGDKMQIDSLEGNQQIVYRYVDINGKTANHYPDNPNGSVNSIAAICDKTGRILGMMPHPEKYIDKTQHPNWRRQSNSIKPHGSVVFKSMINFFK